MGRRSGTPLAAPPPARGRSDRRRRQNRACPPDASTAEKIASAHDGQPHTRLRTQQHQEAQLERHIDEAPDGWCGCPQRTAVQQRPLKNRAHLRGSLPDKSTRNATDATPREPVRARGGAGKPPTRPHPESVAKQRGAARRAVAADGSALAVTRVIAHAAAANAMALVDATALGAADVATATAVDSNPACLATASAAARRPTSPPPSSSAT